VRVYLPATLPLLGRLLDDGQLAPTGGTGFAVTPALREWYAEGDSEELEYAALTEAARAALRLLDADPSAPRRRVVVAAEVLDQGLTAHPELDRAVVRLREPVLLRQVAAVHVDAPEAEPTVRAAAAAILAADLGDDDAQFTVDEAEGHELAWWATQEIADLLGAR